MASLTRFWFVFEGRVNFSVLNLGCGITAYDRADADQFLREEVFSLYGERQIQKVIADIDVRTLDEGHVRPNMGNPAVRGIWFPLTR
jgi:hypothetical protein